MSLREEWLAELRDWNVDGQPGSGGYAPRKEVIKQIAEACGLPFPPDGEQLKADWRTAIMAHFDETPDRPSQTSRV